MVIGADEKEAIRCHIGAPRHDLELNYTLYLACKRAVAPAPHKIFISLPIGCNEVAGGGFGPATHNVSSRFGQPSYHRPNRDKSELRSTWRHKTATTPKLVL